MKIAPFWLLSKDILWYYDYTDDIFYNDAGNPDSMSFHGVMPITMEYDKQQRLVKTCFGEKSANVRYEYFNKQNSNLPSAINHYIP